MEQEWKTGIRIKFGSMSLKYADAREIKANQHTLTFITAVTCVGNNRDENDKPIYTRFNHPYCPHGCTSDNPVIVRYSYHGIRSTKVTVFLHYTEGYEIFQN